MALLETTENLIEEVRSLTNELNQDSLQSERDILPALNRAQEHMMSILARHYPEPYLKEYEFDVSNRPNYKIPEDAWSDLVTKIEMKTPSPNAYRYEVTRAKYRDATRFRAGSKPNVPSYYIIRGREIELIPEPSGTYNGVMWYVRAPEKLVLPQGRITFVSANENRIKLDAIGTSLSTETDALESWVNIIDGQTGVVKATAQIQTINGTQDIIFKSNISSNLLSANGTILNRTPTTDLSTVVDNDGNLNIHPNDYVCSIVGTCVPYFFQPARNFIVSHASADCGRALGIPADSMYREREKFEKEIKDTWTGREAALRIKNKSPHWSLQKRRRGPK
jgi:hypothetical protein